MFPLQVFPRVQDENSAFLDAKIRSFHGTHRPFSRSSSLHPCYAPPSRPPSRLSQSESGSYATDTNNTPPPDSTTRTAPHTPAHSDTPDTRIITSLSTAHNRSAVVPVRIVRRVPSKGEDKTEAHEPRAAMRSSRPITWPSVSRIRTSVSSIFQVRKGKSAHVPGTARPRAWTIPLRQVATAAPTGRKRVRRSASFARFTSIWGAVDGVCEGDADVDEVTQEARGVVEGIRKQWVFEELGEDVAGGRLQAMGIFERDVEQPGY